MPLELFIAYVIEKENQYRTDKQLLEMQVKFMAFVADNVWVTAVGRNFINENKEPTYPRWNDVLNPSKPVPEVTKQDYINHLKSLKKNG